MGWRAREQGLSGAALAWKAVSVTPLPASSTSPRLQSAPEVFTTLINSEHPNQGPRAPRALLKAVSSRPQGALGVAMALLLGRTISSRESCASRPGCTTYSSVRGLYGADTAAPGMGAGGSPQSRTHSSTAVPQIQRRAAWGVCSQPSLLGLPSLGSDKSHPNRQAWEEGVVRKASQVTTSSSTSPPNVNQQSQM